MPTRFPDLGDQAQLRLGFRPRGRTEMLFPGEFKMFQILAQRLFIKLRQEWSGHGCIKAADVINQLTLAHGFFTFDLLGRSGLSFGADFVIGAVGSRVIGILSPPT